MGAREDRREAAVRWVVEYSVDTGRPLGHPEAALRRGRALLEVVESHYQAAKMLLPDCEEVRSLGRIVDELHSHSDRMGQDMLLRVRPAEDPRPTWQADLRRAAWPGGAGQAEQDQAV